MDSSPQHQHQQQQQQRPSSLYASTNQDTLVPPQDGGHTHVAGGYQSATTASRQGAAVPAYQQAAQNTGYGPVMRPLYNNSRQSVYGSPGGQMPTRMMPTRPGPPAQSGELYSNRMSIEAPPPHVMAGGVAATRGNYNIYRSNTTSSSVLQSAAMQPHHPPHPRRAETVFTEQQHIKYRQYEQQQGYYRNSAPVRTPSQSQHQPRPPVPPLANANSLSYREAPYPTFPDGRPLVPAPLAKPPLEPSSAGATTSMTNRPPAPSAQLAPQRSMNLGQLNGGPAMPSNRFSTIGGAARTMLPTAMTPPVQTVVQFESAAYTELPTTEQGSLSGVSSPPTASSNSAGQNAASPAGQPNTSPATEPTATATTSPAGTAAATSTATNMANSSSPAFMSEEIGQSRNSGPAPSGPGSHYHSYQGYSSPAGQAHRGGYTLYDAPVPRSYPRPVSTIMDSPAPAYPNGPAGGVHSVPTSPYAGVSRMHSTAGGLSRMGTTVLPTHWEGTPTRPTVSMSTSPHHHHHHHLGPGGSMKSIPPAQRTASGMIPSSLQQQQQRAYGPTTIPKVPQSYSRQITLSKIPANEEVPSMPGRMTSKNGKIRIQLQFDRPFFNAGGELSGRLELQCSSSRSVMLADMVIELVGYEALAKDHLTPRIFHKTILRLQDAHHPSQAVQEHIDSDNDGFWMARKGRTIFPFRLNIQDTLPNSYESKLGQVRYVTSAIAYMKANHHKEVVHHTREVFIYETWTTDDITQARRKSVKADTSKRLFLGGEGSLEMYAELTRTMVSSGGIVYVNVGVKNLTKKKIMGIKLSLWRHLAASHIRSSISSGAASGMSGNKDQDSVKNYSEIIYKGEDYTFDGDDPRIVVLPVYIPSGVYSLRNTRYLHVQFFVQISLMASLSKALAVELPIYITHASSWSDPPPRVPKDFSFPVHEDEPSVKNKTGVFAKNKKPSPINTTLPSSSGGGICPTGKRASISGPATGTLLASTTSRLSSTSTPSLATTSSLPYGRRAPLKDPDSPTSVLDLAQASNLFVVNPDSSRGDEDVVTIPLAKTSSAPLPTPTAPISRSSVPKPTRPSTTTGTIPSSSPSTLSALKETSVSRVQEEHEMDESHYRPSEIIYDTPIIAKEPVRLAAASSSTKSGTSISSLEEAEEDPMVPTRSDAASPVPSEKPDMSKSSPNAKLELRKTLAKLSISIPTPNCNSSNNSTDSTSSSLNHLTHGTGSSARISPRVLPNATTTTTTITTANSAISPSSSNSQQPMRGRANSDDLMYSRDRRTSVSSSMSSMSRDFSLTPLEQTGSENVESPSVSPSTSMAMGYTTALHDERNGSIRIGSSSQQQQATTKPLSRESSLSASLSRHSSTSSISSFSTSSRVGRLSSRRSSAGSVRIMAISPGPSSPSAPLAPMVIEGVGVVEAPPSTPVIPDAGIEELTSTGTHYSLSSLSAPGSAAGSRTNSPAQLQLLSSVGIELTRIASMDDGSSERARYRHHHPQQILVQQQQQQQQQQQENHVFPQHHLPHTLAMTPVATPVPDEQAIMTLTDENLVSMRGDVSQQPIALHGGSTVPMQHAIHNTSPYQELASEPVYTYEQHPSMSTAAATVAAVAASPSYHHSSGEIRQTYAEKDVPSATTDVADSIAYSKHPVPSHHHHQQHDHHLHPPIPASQGIIQTMEECARHQSRPATPTQASYLMPDDLSAPFEQEQTCSAVVTPVDVRAHTPVLSQHLGGHATPTPNSMGKSSASAPSSRRGSSHMTRAFRGMMITPHAYPDATDSGRHKNEEHQQQSSAQYVLRHQGSASSLRSRTSSPVYSSSSRPQSPFPAMRVNQVLQEYDIDNSCSSGEGMPSRPCSPSHLDTFLSASVSSESLPHLAVSPTASPRTVGSQEHETGIVAVESPVKSTRILEGYGDYYDESPQRMEDPMATYDGGEGEYYCEQQQLEQQEYHAPVSGSNRLRANSRSTSSSATSQSHLVSIRPLNFRTMRSAGAEPTTVYHHDSYSPGSSQQQQQQQQAAYTEDANVHDQLTMMESYTTAASTPRVEPSGSTGGGELRVVNDASYNDVHAKQQQRYHHEQQQLQYERLMRALGEGAMEPSSAPSSGVPSPRYESSLHSVPSDEGDMTTTKVTPATTPLVDGPVDKVQSACEYSVDAANDQINNLDQRRQPGQQEHSMDSIDAEGIPIPIVTVDTASSPADALTTAVSEATTGDDGSSPGMISVVSSESIGEAEYRNSFQYQDQSYQPRTQHAPAASSSISTADAVTQSTTVPVEPAVFAYNTQGKGLGLDVNSYNREYPHEQQRHQQAQLQQSFQTQRAQASYDHQDIVPPTITTSTSPLPRVVTKTSDTPPKEPLVAVPPRASSMSSKVSNVAAITVTAARRMTPPPLVPSHFPYQSHRHPQPPLSPQRALSPQQQHHGGGIFVGEGPKIPPRPPGYRSPPSTGPKFLGTGSRVNSSDHMDFASLPPLPMSPAHPPPGQPMSLDHLSSLPSTPYLPVQPSPDPVYLPSMGGDMNGGVQYGGEGMQAVSSAPTSMPLSVPLHAGPTDAHHDVLIEVDSRDEE